MRHIFFCALIVGLGAWSVAIPAAALTVSPARIEVAVEPGEVYRDEIELFNEQDSEKTFFASYENFEPKGDSGAPHFIGADDGLATWIDIADQVTIRSGERVAIPYSITVPEGAEPGGYFAAIFFGSQPPQGTGGGEVTIGGKIGVLILLRVSGEVAEGGGLLNFGGKDGKRFWSALPASFAYRFNNTGGDRVVPRGEMSITNTLWISSAELLANEKEGSVLPNSTRAFEVLWGEKADRTQEKHSPGFFGMALRELREFHFGWYAARLALVWGDDMSQTAHATYHIFIIPWQLLTIALAILGLVWLAFKVWVTRLKRKILAEVMRNKQ